MKTYYMTIPEDFKNELLTNKSFRDKEYKIKVFKPLIPNTMCALVAICINEVIYYVITSPNLYTYKVDENYYPCAIVMEGDRFQLYPIEQ